MKAEKRRERLLSQIALNVELCKVAQLHPLFFLSFHSNVSFCMIRSLRRLCVFSPLILLCTLATALLSFHNVSIYIQMYFFVQ